MHFMRLESTVVLHGTRMSFQDSMTGSLGEALVACTRARDDHTGVKEAYPEAVRLFMEVS